MCFFISWGAHSELKDLGPAGEYHCNSCGTDCEFHALLTYRVRHVYWLFRWTTGKERHLACTNCGAVAPADRDSFGAAERAAVPFLDRRGWTLGAGAIASLFGMGYVASAANTHENQRMVEQPRIGDIYEVDFAKMVEKPEQPHMYTAMRVVGVRDGEVEFRLASTYYNLLEGVHRDFTAGKTAQDDYYFPEHAAIPRDQLARMAEDGTLADIER